MCAWVLNHFSHVQLFVTLWTVAQQDPLSMGLSKQEYSSGFPCPPPGDLPKQGIKPLWIYIYIYTHTHTHLNILHISFFFPCFLSQLIEISQLWSLLLGKMNIFFYLQKRKWKWKSLRMFRIFATRWTIQSMKFSRPRVGSLSLLQRYRKAV